MHVGAGPVAGLGIKVVHELSVLLGPFAGFVLESNTDAEFLPVGVVLESDSAFVGRVHLNVKVGKGAELVHHNGGSNVEHGLTLHGVLQVLVLEFGLGIDLHVTLHHVSSNSCLESVRGEVDTIFAVIHGESPLGDGLVGNVFGDFLVFASFPFRSFLVRVRKVDVGLGLARSVDLEQLKLSGSGDPEILVKMAY